MKMTTLTPASGKEKNDCSYTSTPLSTFMIYTETVNLYILQRHFKTQGNIYSDAENLNVASMCTWHMARRW